MGKVQRTVTKARGNLDLSTVRGIRTDGAMVLSVLTGTYAMFLLYCGGGSVVAHGVRQSRHGSKCAAKSARQQMHDIIGSGAIARARGSSWGQVRGG